MTAAARARAIEIEASALIATLPDLPDERLAALAHEALALSALVDGEAARVAATFATLVEQYRAGRAVLEGWGIVASAAHSLARAIAEPEAGQAAALAAVRFELETLLPPQAPPSAKPSTPDVPLTALVRR